MIQVTIKHGMKILLNTAMHLSYSRGKGALVAILHEIVFTCLRAAFVWQEVFVSSSWIKTLVKIFSTLLGT